MSKQQVNRLKEIRADKGVKMAQLTAICGVSMSTLSGIERYLYRPSDATKQKIADALGVEVALIWPDVKVEV